jgi:hypothetical protein
MRRGGSAFGRPCHRARRERNLTASIGIGANKLLAKIASDFKTETRQTSVEEPFESAETIYAIALLNLSQHTDASNAATALRLIFDSSAFLPIAGVFIF